jgi:hypothetical protein
LKTVLFHRSHRWHPRHPQAMPLYSKLPLGKRWQRAGRIPEWLQTNARTINNQQKAPKSKIAQMSIDCRHYSRFTFTFCEPFCIWSGATYWRQHAELCMSLCRFKDRKKRNARCVRRGTDVGHVPLKGAMIPPNRAVVSHVVKAAFEARPAKIWAKAT